MAKARNVFLKSKMNKDLDARLIQNGEYRDAVNIQISQSEGSDVGAVENAKGNAIALNYNTLTGISDLKTIGFVVDQNSEAVFLFLTNNTNHFLVRYTPSSADILTTGSYLNFSTSYPVNGATVVENLLFWSDNYNQPRKINWQSALTYNTTSYYYYNNEQQISVAKFAPYLPPRLLDLTSDAGYYPSTMTDASDLPDTLIGVTLWATENLRVKSFRDGTPIAEVQNLTDWQASCDPNTGYPAWCYYNFDPTLGNVYGLIYNIHCMTFSNGTIAPIGFKLPKEADFTQLSASVSADGNKLKSTSNSSTQSADPNFPYVQGTWIVSDALSVDYAGDETNNEFFDALPTGYRRGNSSQDFLNAGAETLNPGPPPNYTLNSAYYWAQGGSGVSNAKFVQIDALGNITAPATPPATSTGDYVGYYIRCIREDDYDGWNGDPDYLKERFVRFSYRFKFDDNEYSLVAPFTQTAFIPEQEGYFFPGDEEKAFRSTIVEFMQNYVNNVVLNIELPSGSIAEDYKIKEIDILIKESDGLAFKVLETIKVDNSFDALYSDRTTSTSAVVTATSVKIVSSDLENGIIPGYILEEIGGVALSPPAVVLSIELDTSATPPQYEITVNQSVSYTAGDTFSWSYSPQPVYQYNYQSLKPYKTLPEKEVVRVYDKVPVRALAQETSGNRIMYGNFIANHASPNYLDYKISVAEKSPQEDIEYPNHNIKQNRNYKVGVVLADKWGRQTDVVLSSYDNEIDEFNQPEEGSNVFHAYKRNNFQPNIDTWEGDNLQITFDNIIPEDQNYQGISGYPGAYAKSSFYTTPYNGTPVVAPFRFFRETDVFSDKTYEYQILNLFSGWSNTTYQQYFSTDKYLRGYYKDYVKVNSVSYNNSTDVLTIVCSNRISDNYLFEYTLTQDTLLGEKVQATYELNELGFYSYRIVVQQKEQDYYNVYLPGVVNGYPVNGNTNERNESAHVTLIGDNVNKIPRDLKDVGPAQTEFNSSVKLYGRVTNVFNSSLKNIQYFPSKTPDTVTLISDQRSLFGPIPDYTLTSTDALNGNCVYPGFAVAYEEVVPDGSGGTQSISNKTINSNPLIAKLNTNDGIGEIVTQWQPITGEQYPSSMYLAVYETEPVESVLDIYWESSTTGLISDLNLLVLGTSPTPVSFTPDVVISLDENDTVGYVFTSSFFPVNSQGDNVLDTIGTLTSVYSKNPDGTLNTTVNRNNEFSLNSNTNGSYTLALAATQVALADVETAEYYLFTIEIVKDGESTFLNLETTLQNAAPEFQPNCNDLSNCTQCSGPCFTDVDYFIQNVSETTSVLMGPGSSCPGGGDGQLIVENGSSDVNRKDQQLAYQITLATKEPVNTNCTGGTPELVQDVNTPEDELVFSVSAPNPYEPGQPIIQVTGYQPLSPGFFYKIYLTATDRSLNNEPSAEGLTDSVVIAFVPSAIEYDSIIWAGYQNVPLDPSVTPSNQNGPYVNDPGPAYDIIPSQTSGATTKKGVLANWTGSDVDIWGFAYTRGTNYPSGDFGFIVVNFKAWTNQTPPYTTPPNVTKTITVNAGAGSTGEPIPVYLGRLSAFDNSIPNSAPSEEEGSLINNVEFEVESYNDNNAGSITSPPGICGLMAVPAGQSPGGGQPNGVYPTSPTPPWLVATVNIGVPFPQNSNGTYNNQNPWN